MYDSALTEWCASKMGPKRDVMGDLANAVREKGMVFGLSSHRAEHWFFINGGMTFPSDVQDPKYSDFYGPAMPGPQHKTPEWRSMDWHPRPHAAFLDDWLFRLIELIDNYQPQLIWFDWWIEQTVFAPYLQKFAAYYYNRGTEWGKGVAVNFKHEAFPEGVAVYDIERGQLSGAARHLWQNDTSISKNSWGYTEDQDYKEAVDLIQDLVDVVSKNGALLLNIGPRSDGTIPDPEQNVLRKMGRWLDVNGDAIYSTRPWRVFGEGPTEIPEGYFSDTKRSAFTGLDFRFTAKDDKLYAIGMTWPGTEAVIKALAAGSLHCPEDVTSVRLLGSDAELNWSRNGSGLYVNLPDKPPSETAYALEIALQA